MTVTCMNAGPRGNAEGSKDAIDIITNQNVDKDIMISIQS